MSAITRLLEVSSMGLFPFFGQLVNFLISRDFDVGRNPEKYDLVILANSLRTFLHSDVSLDLVISEDKASETTLRS